MSLGIKHASEPVRCDGMCLRKELLKSDIGELGKVSLTQSILEDLFPEERPGVTMYLQPFKTITSVFVMRPAPVIKIRDNRRGIKRKGVPPR